MRPVFVGLGLFLVSCSNINATQPAHNACARDAGGANQCPGTDAGPWVCGVGAALIVAGIVVYQRESMVRVAVVPTVGGAAVVGSF